MGPKEKQAYLKLIVRRYKKADSKKKSKILDEFCAVCHYHRKYGIRLLNKQPKRKPSKLGRLLKNQIPIKTDHWHVNKPGYNLGIYWTIRRNFMDIWTRVFKG